jgi:hypothetical protein
VPRPSALFAFDGAIALGALGALGALHDAGVRVPHEIAVVGFDDVGLGQPAARGRLIALRRGGRPAAACTPSTESSWRPRSCERPSLEGVLADFS